MDLLILMSISSTLVLSLFTSAYVGLALVYAIITFRFYFLKKVSAKFIILQSLLVVAILALTPIIITEILAKLDSYSGEERIKAVTYGYYYFSQYYTQKLGSADEAIVTERRYMYHN